MAKWEKTTPYGDYKDLLQNHKQTTGLYFDVENKRVLCIPNMHRLLIQVRALGLVGKHIGSKPVSRLKNHLRAANRRNEILSRLKEQFKTQETSAEDADNK